MNPIVYRKFRINIFYSHVCFQLLVSFRGSYFHLHVHIYHNVKSLFILLSIYSLRIQNMNHGEIRHL